MNLLVLTAYEACGASSSVLLRVRQYLSMANESRVRIKTLQLMHRLLIAPNSSAVIEGILADFWSGLPTSRFETNG